MSLVIRPRTDADLPALGDVLLEQQAASGYPHRKPLPMAPEDFVAREGTLATWTALLDDAPVGHIAVLPVHDPATRREPELSRLWMAGHDLPAEHLAEIGVYFTATSVRGRGIGAALIGALIIIRPGMGVFQPAALLPLAATTAVRPPPPLVPVTMMRSAEPGMARSFRRR